jgi:hypothetical protein
VVEAARLLRCRLAVLRSAASLKDSCLHYRHDAATGVPRYFKATDRFPFSLACRGSAYLPVHTELMASYALLGPFG